MQKTITVTRKFEFDAGHRVLGHKGKCQNIHGHRYVAELTITCSCLDDLGILLDFSEIKRVVGEWIDLHWDHNLLLNSQDPLANAEFNQVKKPYLFIRKNPTAEVMVLELVDVARDLFAENKELRRVEITKCRIYETPNCWAEWRYPNL
jgi:6-pyruvoyltetrahydropterin/6-carboxytetrahydropterin synthase